MAKADMKQRLISALETLGVEIAGRHADPLRWSATDLATDLAPLLEDHTGHEQQQKKETPASAPSEPYYIVYAGWYGHCPDGKTWDDTDWTYGAWSPQGNDSVRAVAKLNEYQQQGYDFCGIEVAFNS